MKDVLRSAAMAFQMFSVVPMPRVEWKKENMRYMLCCLPLGGQLGVIGVRDNCGVGGFHIGMILFIQEVSHQWVKHQPQSCNTASRRQ